MKIIPQSKDRAQSRLAILLAPYLRGDKARLYEKAVACFEAFLIYRPEEDERSSWYLCISYDRRYTYTVGPNACSCAAGIQPRPRLCYHRIARRISILYDAICADIARERPPTIRESQRAMERQIKHSQQQRPEGAKLH